jgi:hypothetical protein
LSADSSNTLKGSDRLAVRNPTPRS